MDSNKMTKLLKHEIILQAKYYYIIFFPRRQEY